MNTEIVARLTAAAGGASITAVIEQNKQIMAELKKTQDMVQLIIDAIKPRR
jgi:3-hydroxy-3-methylglutaryl CoA synthase